MDSFEEGEERPERMTAARLRERADAAIARLRQAGEEPHPVRSRGKRIAGNFWGKAWCRQLEQWQDYAFRLPRGRSYFLNGAVIDLAIAAGEIHALVMGENLYTVHIRIDCLPPDRRRELARRCAGQLTGVVDLLEGRLAESVIAVLCDPEHGVLPRSDEIHLDCNCPDWADLCKHLAAVLYAVGARLDQEPEMLFLLRGMAQQELLPASGSAAPELSPQWTAELGEIFGIDLELS